MKCFFTTPDTLPDEEQRRLFQAILQNDELARSVRRYERQTRNLSYTEWLYRYLRRQRLQTNSPLSLSFTNS